MSRKQRADILAVERGLAPTRHKAQALIMAGRILTDGRTVDKPGQLIRTDMPLSLSEGRIYVSRGGMKLEEALRYFEFDLRGRIAADLGASTGGFTDCLLQNGVKRVYAVDVDTKQLDWTLSRDERVLVLEKNARYLSVDDFELPPEFVTADLSFISIVKVLPAVGTFIGRGYLLSLIKPQFEVGRESVGRGGVVKDPALHERVLLQTAEQAEALGFPLIGIMRPSVKGQKGNQEFFFLWNPGNRGLDPRRRESLIKEVVWNEKDS